jgi:[protein-PII] uridylyltransferase
VARVATDPEFGAALRGDAEARAAFVQLLCTVRSTALRKGSVLAELHDVGLLLAMIPEFAPVVGRVHHDLYHVYTVDVHSVAAVDRLRALMRGELVNEHALASRLSAEVSRPEVLFFATLLHDVGKAFGGRDHSQRGAEMAQTILARFGLGDDDVAQIRHLILHHLRMYRVAVGRDLSEPDTIAEFMRDARDRETLRDLYLLTIADISTTGPTSMTAWKSRVLEQLFAATDAALAGAVGTDPARLARIREQVAGHCPADLDPVFLQEFLDTMPDRYLLSNTAAEIAAHAHVAFAARAAPIGLRLVPSRHPEVAELCIVTAERSDPADDGTGVCVITHDRPGLLAAIAAAMTASRLEIHAAQVYSRRGAGGTLQAVDVFWVRDRTGGLEAVERALPKLECDLRGVIEGRVAARDLVRPRSTSRWSEPPSPPVLSEVTVDNHTSSEHTIIEVVAKDRPGLLFTLANALHEAGLTIAVAKVNTEGNRVVDVFYVHEIRGGKLATLKRADAVRTHLLAALGAPTAAAGTVVA